MKIPIFTSQLEKSREAVDAANLRAAYAECAADVLTEDTATVTTVYKQVDPVQTTSGWDLKVEKIGSIKTVPDIVKSTAVYVSVKADGSAEITTTAPTEKAKKLD